MGENDTAPPTFVGIHSVADVVVPDTNPVRVHRVVTNTVVVRGEDEPGPEPPVGERDLGVAAVSADLHSERDLALPLDILQIAIHFLVRRC